MRSCLNPASRVARGVLALALVCASVSVGVARAGEDGPTPAALDLLPPGQDVSDTVVELAGWIVATGDSQDHPFAIIDKAAAQVLVFDADGRPLGAAPGLFGSAVGDHAAPGVGLLALRDIPADDRTTPAGRFVGGFGPSKDQGRVLWVDFESAVSMHPTATNVPAERRPERLASPEPDDNRVTHGCINVAPEFYEQVVQPAFERGGVFYILPDEMTLADAFPAFAQSRAEPDVADEDGALAAD